MIRSPFLPIAALVLLAACGTKIDVPAPGDVAAAPEAPEPPPSVVQLPVTLELGALAAKLEDLVPRRQSREDEWHELGRAPVVGMVYVKEMWERDPLQVTLNGTRVEVITRVRYRARIAEQSCLPRLGCRWTELGSCGQEGPMPSLRVGLRAQVSFKSDWLVEPRTSARPVEAGVRCRLTRARIDVTERVQKAVQGLMDRTAPRVNAELREAVALRRRVESVWSALQTPLHAGSDIYLVFRPESVAVAPLASRGTQLSTTVAVTARPQVLVGQRPAIDSVPLPDFAEHQPAARGFRISMVAELPYTTADRLLAENLVGRQFEVRGRTVRVRGAHLYAAGRRLVLRVGLAGDARGTLYFVGTPRYDPVAQLVTVPDLDFSVETRNVLGRSADWLLHDRLRDQVRAAARFPVGEQVSRIHADVNAAMTRELSPGVRLTGRIDALRPLGVNVTARSLATVIEADGQARVDITIR